MEADTSTSVASLPHTWGNTVRQTPKQKYSLPFIISLMELRTTVCYIFLKTLTVKETRKIDTALCKLTMGTFAFEWAHDAMSSGLPR